MEEIIKRYCKIKKITLSELKEIDKEYGIIHYVYTQEQRYRTMSLDEAVKDIKNYIKNKEEEIRLIKVYDKVINSYCKEKGLTWSEFLILDKKYDITYNIKVNYKFMERLEDRLSVELIDEYLRARYKVLINKRHKQAQVNKAIKRHIIRLVKELGTEDIASSYKFLRSTLTYTLLTSKNTSLYLKGSEEIVKILKEEMEFGKGSVVKYM